MSYENRDLWQTHGYLYVKIGDEQHIFTQNDAEHHARRRVNEFWDAEEIAQAWAKRWQKTH
jgi:hypothetical protein